MKRVGCFLLVATLLIPAALRAQDRPDPARTELEARVLARLLDRASKELELDAEGRSKLERVLRESGERRRELAREGAKLRRALADAARDPTTTDDEFEEILEDLEELRAREFDAWREEQQALADFLTPRQRAEATLLFARLNDRLQEFRRQRQREDGSPGGRRRRR